MDGERMATGDKPGRQQLSEEPGAVNLQGVMQGRSCLKAGTGFKSRTETESELWRA